jgi:hypothetical protein
MATAETVYNLISSLDTSGIEAFTTLFAYAGFNPEMVHDHFASIVSAKGISDSEFSSDMRALIALGALKGNYTAKNAKKISEEGKTKANSLYRKYDMKQGSLGDNKKAIILPRVLSAFPELTSRVILKVNDRNFGDNTNFLPRIIKNPVFPSLIPKTLEVNVRETLLYLYNVYSANQSLVINPNSGSFDNAFKTQKTYVYIAFNSSVPPEKTRIALFKSQLDEIVQAISSGKDLKVGTPPSNRVDAAQARSAINSI